MASKKTAKKAAPAKKGAGVKKKTAKPAQATKKSVKKVAPKLKTATKGAPKAKPIKLSAPKAPEKAPKGKSPGHKVGDILFYPRQGLCRFEAVVHEMNMDFFLLKPVNGPGHATIRVPLLNAAKVGLRPPSKTMTFAAACAHLKKLSNEFESDWRKRNMMLTEQTTRGETTDLLAAAKIYAVQDAIKPLSHQERRDYEKIVQFAADEIALLEQGSSQTLALNLMEFLKAITQKNRPSSSYTGAGAK